MTKKIKVYNRRTRKFSGGLEITPTFEILPTTPTPYTKADSYKLLIEKFVKNLNLFEEIEGITFMRVKIKGCFDYLQYISFNLQDRRQIKKLSDANEVIGRLKEINEEIFQLKKDCIDLKGLLEKSDPLETEIVFYFILGCIQLLPNYISEIKAILQKPTAKTFPKPEVPTFPIFTEYIEKKLERVNIQIEDIKEQVFIPKKIEGVQIVPVKIKDNVEFYKLWKRSRQEPTKEITFKEVNDLLDPDPEVVQDKDGEAGNK